jgi:hypothetical protein
MDIYVVKNDGDILYRNAGKGMFENVTGNAHIGSKTGGHSALFFDMDHDGDLDMFETGTNNLMFRNNSDGTFIEQAEKMGLSGKGNNSRNAAFGDFDDDGDIDFAVATENAGVILYSNQREGVFRDITTECGIKDTKGSRSVAVADYNNDGFLDLFVANDGTSKLFKNKGDATFELTDNKTNGLSALANIKVNDAKFLDFDNDGFQDIIIAGEAKTGNGRGVLLYHNNEKGSFEDLSRLLPDEPKAAHQITLFDYNKDGDIDIVLSKINGGITLLRNDGGNNNHYVRLALVGLRAGSAKNNHFGIGAKVEMRSGDLYETMVVSDPNIHFGLGNRAKADIIRITWTNGVPQNIFAPGTDQALIEAQTLKGSCPFLFTWDGNKYTFVKDVMWRSALGMPLGIMGGTTAHAFADASDDYIKVPGEILKSKNGRLSIQLTSELWETMFFDKVQLVAVDHPESTDIFVPEQFSPPPFPGNLQYQVSAKHPPVSAIDNNGNDMLSYITAKDDKYISDFNPGQYQGITEMHDLILDPGNLDGNKLVLFLNGWIFPTDASINAAISQSSSINVVRPLLQVLNNKGEWVTAIENLGFPMGKDKTVIADLSGKFLSSDHRIRIRTNMEVYWDYIFFTDKTDTTPTQTTELNPVSADLHYRGFSYSFRKGGRYGPHWFDYYKVDKNPKWRDLTGNYTRYGDVLPLLKSSDNQYIISNAGDETSIEFDTRSLPELQKGWKRDYLIHTVGWVKDGDLNTATGNTVLPLPYHGMKSYPPSNTDIYPDDPALRKYNEEYNTRVVRTDDFRYALKKQ